MRDPDFDSFFNIFKRLQVTYMGKRMESVLLAAFNYIMMHASVQRLLPNPAHFQNLLGDTLCGWFADQDY